MTIELRVSRQIRGALEKCPGGADLVAVNDASGGVQNDGTRIWNGEDAETAADLRRSDLSAGPSKNLGRGWRGGLPWCEHLDPERSNPAVLPFRSASSAFLLFSAIERR
jgi:hypothetical protein